MEAEAIHYEFWMADAIFVTLTRAELNRLRFEASIATTERPDRYGAWVEFLEATDDV